jgi:hypothetical protein
MENCPQFKTFARRNKAMDVVRHDAPTVQFVPLSLKEKKSLFHDSSDARDREEEGARIAQRLRSLRNVFW